MLRLPYLFALILYLFISKSNAQNTTSDSLWNVINESDHSREKLDAYNELARLISFSDPDSALKIGSFFFTYAKELKNKEYMVYALMSRVRHHFNEGNYEASKNVLDTTLVVADGDYKNGLDIVHHYYGMYFNLVEEYDSALYHFNLASTYYLNNNADEAILASLYGGIGNVHFALKDFNNALNFYNRALNKLSEDDYYVRGSLYLNIGEVLTNIDTSYSVIRDVFKKAISQQEAAYDSLGLLMTYGKLMTLEAENGHFRIADEYKNLADELIPFVGTQTYEYTDHILAKATLFLLKREYNKSIALLKQIYDHEQNIYGLMIHHHMLALELLRKNYAGKGDSFNYQLYTERYINLKDSLYQAEIIASTLELEKKYESARKEKQLIEQECAIQDQATEIRIIDKEKRTQRNYIVGLVLFILLLLVLAGLATNRQRIKNSRDKLKNELTEAELKNSKLEKLQLMEKMKHQERELTAYALSMVRKNDLLAQLQEKVSKMQVVSQDVKSISSLIRTNIAQENEWEEFNMRFKKVNPEFYKKLQSRFPDLTVNDMKICVLMKLNLSSREISNLIGVNVRSVDMSKYRMKKRMNLGPEDKLQEFIYSI